MADNIPQDGSVGITSRLMGGSPWGAIASIENIFRGPPLRGPKFLQILYNANDRFS